MAAGTNVKVPDFARAAERRLECARFLAARTQFRLEAMYLAGYAIECDLKALLLARTPRSRHAVVTRGFVGAGGHNYDYLRAQLHLAKVTIPREVAAQLRLSSSWSTALRYEVARIDLATLERFLAATEAIHAWVVRSL